MIGILVFLATLRYKINRAEEFFKDTKFERSFINTRHLVQSYRCEKQPLSLWLVPEKAVVIRDSQLHSRLFYGTVTKPIRSCLEC
jgi:hypothetical protein